MDAKDQHSTDRPSTVENRSRLNLGDDRKQLHERLASPEVKFKMTEYLRLKLYAQQLLRSEADSDR